MESNTLYAIVVFLYAGGVFALGMLTGWHMHKPTMKEAARMMAKRKDKLYNRGGLYE